VSLAESQALSLAQDLQASNEAKQKLESEVESLRSTTECRQRQSHCP